MIDARAVWHVTGGDPLPNAVWDDSDEVLWSLAPNSPRMKKLGNICTSGAPCSPAEVYRVVNSQGVSQVERFLRYDDLGLLFDDNIDAIDVGVALGIGEDCNGNGFYDQCDRNRNIDVHPECVPPKPVPLVDTDDGLGFDYNRVGDVKRPT